MHARTGDDVYFQHREGPQCGRVLCTGRHGAIVEIEGRQHRVRWEQMLGHRQRMVPNLRVVDQGDDGAIVEDEQGRREFVLGELPKAIEEEPMEKSQRVLFLKATPIKGRPGLSLTGTTDKHGRAIRRWKKSGGRAAPKSAASHDAPRGTGPKAGAEDWKAQVASERAEVERQNAAVLRAQTKQGSIRVPMQVLGRFDSYEEAQVEYEREHARLWRSDEIGLKKSILFLKSVPIKNRPGLSLQDVTDRIGKHTKRWKRSGAEDSGKPTQRPEGAGVPFERAPKDMPRDFNEHASRESDSATGKIRGRGHDAGHEERRGSARGYGTHDIGSGDEVSFHTGNAKGSGKVLAEGADGATVQDQQGNRHLVLWKFITGFHGARKSEGGGGSSNGGNGGGDDGDNGYHWIPPDKFSAEEIYEEHDDPGVTPAEVLAKFPLDTRDKMDKAVARLAKIEQTTERFKIGNQYKPERARKHAQIIDKLLSQQQVAAATPPPGEKPTLYVLGGRGGSGKSGLKNRVYDPNTSVVIDPDKIKEEFKNEGYEGWNAAEFHEESSDIAMEVIGIARRKGLNVVVDKTLKSLSLMREIEAFKKAQYLVEVHYMFLPRKQAAMRTVERFLGRDGMGKGRMVPIDVVLSNTENERNFDALRREADAWSFWSNDVPRGAEPVLISRHGESDGKARDGKRPEPGERPLGKGAQISVGRQLGQRGAKSGVFGSDRSPSSRTPASEARLKKAFRPWWLRRRKPEAAFLRQRPEPSPASSASVTPALGTKPILFLRRPRP